MAYEPQPPSLSLGLIFLWGSSLYIMKFFFLLFICFLSVFQPKNVEGHRKHFSSPNIDLDLRNRFHSFVVLLYTLIYPILCLWPITFYTSTLILTIKNSCELSPLVIHLCSLIQSFLSIIHQVNISRRACTFKGLEQIL